MDRRPQILSIAFEFAEYSLQHQLANFAEVCHDRAYHTSSHSRRHFSAGGIMYVPWLLFCLRCHVERLCQWILDVLICNWLGTYLGQSRRLAPIDGTHWQSSCCRYEDMPILRSEGTLPFTRLNALAHSDAETPCFFGCD